MSDAKKMLLRALQEGFEGDSRPTRPHVDAQRMELTERFANYQQRQHLVPGTFVEEKHGLGYLVADSRPRCILMLWRMLDLTSFTDQDLVRQWRKQHHIDMPDCVIAMVQDDGSDIITMLHELRRLKRSVS